MNVGGVKFKGWKFNGKIIFHTPGHSPCSISLLWPERKAVLVSDADWVGNPVFMMLKHANYPRDVIFISNMVALSLEEAGVI